MNAFSLPDLICFLNEQTAENFRGDAVSRYLEPFKLDEEPFVPFIFFREDTYARNLVHKSDLYELIVLTWLPGQKSPIHDHAGQRCWTVVLSGALTFKNFDLDEKRKTPAPLGRADVVTAGGQVYIDDDMGIHSIANVSSKPAISLHLYAGPITNCRVYNEATRQLEKRDLEYFTTFDGEFGIDPAL